jgi:hypothetical protein
MRPEPSGPGIWVGLLSQPKTTLRAEIVRKFEGGLAGSVPLTGFANHGPRHVVGRPLPADPSVMESEMSIHPWPGPPKSAGSLQHSYKKGSCCRPATKTGLRRCRHGNQPPWASTGGHVLSVDRSTHCHSVLRSGDRFRCSRFSAKTGLATCPAPRSIDGSV